jgi:hypothetical protein
MGPILSPFPYDGAACHTLQSVSLRRPAILHHASVGFPISRHGPVYPSIAAMPSTSEIAAVDPQAGHLRVAGRVQSSVNSIAQPGELARRFQ